MPSIKRRAVTVFRNDGDEAAGTVAKKPRKCRTCQYAGCELRASYGLLTSRKEKHVPRHTSNVADKRGQALFCAEHKQAGMVNVASKTCHHPECLKHPTFGTEKGKASFCAEHKQAGMVDVRSKACRHPGCLKQPSFGTERGKPSFCAEHKQAGMVNVASKTCRHPECLKRRTFGTERGKPLFCAEHKHAGMVNVASKACRHPDCLKRPAFGAERGKPLFCAEHKQAGMVDVASRTCAHPDCLKQPTFGTDLGKRIFCAEHKQAGMLNATNKLCSNYDSVCFSYATKGCDGHCLRCYIQKHPEAPRNRRFRDKERRVHECIRAHFPDVTIIHDRAVQGGCSRRRPDFLIDLGSHVVIVEVDENQHQHIDEICENMRMMQLFTDIGSRSLVMVRFNPDDYVDSSGKKQPSSFKVHGKTGAWIVRDQDKWNKRLNFVVRVVAESMASVPDKEVTVIRLFFDGACPNTGVVP